MAQAVVAGWYLQRFTQTDEGGHVAVQGFRLAPYLALFVPEWFEPLGQGGADFNETAAAGLGALGGDFQ